MPETLNSSIHIEMYTIWSTSYCSDIFSYCTGYRTPPQDTGISGHMYISLGCPQAPSVLMLHVEKTAREPGKFYHVHDVG